MIRGKNIAAERFGDRLDRQAVLGDYGTGRGEMDLLMINLNSKRPKEKDFVSFYGEEDVTRDLIRTREIEESPFYQKERTEKSTLVEAVIAYGINNRGWLGDGVKVRMTSKVDDILRGVDMMIFLPSEDNKFVGLAIDVTSSDNEYIWEEKISKSLQRLGYGDRSRGNPGGQMTKLKYLFKNDPEKSTKVAYNHYVVTMEGAQADSLADVFCSKEISDKKKYLELQIRIQLIASLRKQAYLQLSNVMDMYCGFGDHVLESYRDLSEGDKDDFENLFKWVSNNLEDIEKHLKETWTRKSYNRVTKETKEVEENNKQMMVSIRKNLFLINYLSALLVNIVEDKKEADMILENKGGHDGFGNAGLNNIVWYNRSDIPRLKKIIYQGNRLAQ